MDGGSGQGGRRSSEAAALGEEGATDGGFGLERCSLKDAAAIEEGLTKGCSTERKAAAGEEVLTKECSTERKPAAGEEVLKKGCSTERKAAVGDADPAARVRMTRLSKMEVIRHLSRDPCSIAPYNVDSLRRLVQKEMPNENVPEEVLRVVADSFNDGMRNKFSVFQAWVLAVLQEKGYVEVPELQEKGYVELAEGRCREAAGGKDRPVPTGQVLHHCPLRLR